MQNKIFKIIISLSIFFLLPHSSEAAPAIDSVSGTISDRQSVTIAGGGFGESGPNVAMFDDFERGNDGQALSAAANIGTYTSIRNTVYSFADSKLSNSKGARIIPTGASIGDYAGFAKTFAAPTTEVFMTSIGYIPNGHRWPNSSDLRTYPDSSCLKHHWAYYGANGYQGDGQGIPDGGTEPDIISAMKIAGDTWARVSSNDTTPRGNFDLTDDKDAMWDWDEPVRFSFWAKTNGVSAVGSDGLFQKVGPGGQIYARYKDQKAWCRAGDLYCGFDRASFPGWIRVIAGDPGFPTSNYVIDDIYMATGPNAAARIELGNNPVYANCTKMAISTPTAWSDSAVTATIREGLFKSGDSIYLFVVDANGDASPAYGPMTFGSTIGDTTAPEAPTGLGVL
ncbi:MAG: hypothetical protein HGA36_02890 [Candidatus Moranbacteria bacterium]|nr:hypothetical protein [Candidatus Moranbacteria bacterium]